MKAHISFILPRALLRLARVFAAWTALLLMVLAHGQAMALPNVLILSTKAHETNPTAVDLLSNLVLEFGPSVANTTRVDNIDDAGTVIASTFVPSGGGTYDLVIVARLVLSIEAGNLAAINTAIAQRKANGFVLLYDTGGNPNSWAATNLRDELNAVGNFSPALSVTGPVSQDISSILNTNSPFSGSFSGINPMRLGWLNYLGNVPPANALYLAPGSTIPAAGSTTPLDSVTGVFVPTAQSFGGTGACVIGFPDSSMFETRNYVGGTSGGVTNPTTDINKGKLAPAWLHAVSPTGACGFPAISKAFAPTQVVSGGSSTLTITVTNPTGATVSALNVTDALPTPLVVGAGSTASTTCSGGTLAATVGGNSVSLTGATLPVGGCTITVPVQWPAASAALCTGTGTTVTNTITPGSGFTTSLGQVNTPATATLSCLGAPNLGITKSAPTPALQVGQQSIYTLTVTNHGAAAAAGATVLDSLPAGLTLQSATGTNWSCNTGASPVSCIYSAAIAAAASASPLLITVVPQVSAAGTTLTNYASVDPLGGNVPPAPGPACAPASACAQSTSAAPVASPTPVPTLSQWALATLALLMAWLAWGQRLPGARRHG